MKEINILQLYPKDMNIYGDWGNTLTLIKRTEWHGYKPNVIDYNPGDEWPEQIDLIVGGGGQDSGQDKIKDDLISRSEQLHQLADSDTPMLVICGLYQLFGHFFKTQDGHVIPGIGILDVETTAGPERLIGNIITHSEEFGDIIGYENHSGQTFLKNNLTNLGDVIKGAGNNGQDNSEGARYKKVIGTYLHGSLLPKNPKIADYLIANAAIKRYGSFEAQEIDDSITERARQTAMARPR